MATAHVDFDSERAAELSGIGAPDARRMLLVGAGAIGSHVAEILAREGRFKWSVVDEDFLLPHNLARHRLNRAHIGLAKAEGFGAYLGAVRGGQTVDTALVNNIVTPGQNTDALTKNLATAELILDATASVAAARRLSDMPPTTARVASVFFNPSGTSGVLLLESADRSVRLRDLEAQYYRLVLRSPALAAHLHVSEDALLHTGACRALTNRIPENQVAILSGLVAAGYVRALANPVGNITIWTTQTDGSVAVVSSSPALLQPHPRADWVITLDVDIAAHLHRMRAARVPVETGGVLLGVIDTEARRVHVVEALACPEDSAEERSTFERGIQQLIPQIEQSCGRVMGQVRYVGEWHSHPPRYSTAPSGTDLSQIFWLATTLAIDSHPALMLIVGDNDINVIFGEQIVRQGGRNEAG
jgi:integrative and conjugative element protein (TIGR02256 family)